MTFLGHIIFSLLSIILIKKTYLITPLVNGDILHIIPITIISSILPDIDHTKSILGKKVNFISIFLYKTFGHRNFTHSIISIIIFIIILRLINNIEYLIPLDCYYSIIIGYLNHILIDMFTKTGVPFLWPLKYKFKIPIIKNNNLKYSEKLICTIFLLIIILYK